MSAGPVVLGLAQMSLHTTITRVGGATVVTLEGNVDLASIGVLHGELSRVVRAHPGDTVIVDLDTVSALDDAGLGVLLGAAANARETDGDLEIVCSRAALRARLDRTGFDRAVVVRGTIA